MKAELIESAGLYTLTWEEFGVKATVERIKSDGRGTRGEVNIFYRDNNGYSPILPRYTLTLETGSARIAAAKICKEATSDIGWNNIITELCTLVLDKYREGEPVEELWDDDAKPPEFLLHPIIPLNQPSIIFGDGGVGKSYLTLLFAICVSLPWKENKLGLLSPEKPIRVLLLDWETNSNTVKWRLKCLRTGLGLPSIPLLYRRCFQSLPEDIVEIQRLVKDNDIGCIIIDSIGAACGGDLNAPDVASKFIQRHVRQLGVTSISIGHTSKDQQREKTVFGSAFWRNAARSVWEARKNQEVGEDVLDIGLYHRKANESKLHHPLGFKILFGEQETNIERTDLRAVPSLSKGLALATQIENILAHGIRDLKELSEELDTTEGTIKTTLYRNKERFIHLTDGWGLVHRDL